MVPLIVNLWVLETYQPDRHGLFDVGLENSEDTNSIIKSCFNMSIGEVNINESFVSERLIYYQADIPCTGKRQIYRN